MSRTNRLLGAVLLLVVLTAMAGAGSAAGKITKKKFHGFVTLSYQKNVTGTDRFSGTVSSPKGRCERGALVELGYRPAFEGGGGSNLPRTTVATTRTDSNGNWVIDYEVTPNSMAPFSSFSASSPKRVLKSKKRNVRLVCKFETSNVTTV